MFNENTPTTHAFWITPDISGIVSEDGKLITICKDGIDITLSIHELRALIIRLNSLYKEKFGLSF